MARGLMRALVTLAAFCGFCGFVVGVASSWAQTAAQTTSPRGKPVKPAVQAAAPEAALLPEQLAIADQVHAGSLPCDDGVRVVLTADAKVSGYFNLQLGRRQYRVFPVESRSGAIRLEDAHADVVWIQLSNKSMLMSRKLGRRLADECRSERQAEVASAMRVNPPPSLLEPLPDAAASANKPKD